jgi:hypothetical protein
LSYAIAYLAAKSSKDNISGIDLLNQALRVSDVGCISTKEDLMRLFEKWIKEDYISREAYELYGACLMKVIKEIAKVCENDVITLLKRFNDRPDEEAIATSKVLEFTEWLRRLAEATIPG